MQEPNLLIQQALARADLDSPPLSSAERGLLEFVRLVTLHAYKTTDLDIERLRSLGWSDPQIAECVYITALFAFFNRVADAFGLEDPNYFENLPVLTDPGVSPPKAGPSSNESEETV